MTEHRHEWRANLWDSEIIVVACEHCGEAMPVIEIERRLNATEALSAEDADFYARLLEARHEDASMLREYADILEGGE